MVKSKSTFPLFALLAFTLCPGKSLSATGDLPIGYKGLLLGMPQEEAQRRLLGNNPQDLAEADAELAGRERQARLKAEHSCMEQVQQAHRDLPRYWTTDSTGRPLPPKQILERCIEERTGIEIDTAKMLRERGLAEYVREKYQQIGDLRVLTPILEFDHGKLVRIGVGVRGENNYILLREAVHARYGKPDRTNVETYRSLYNVKREALEEIWLRGRATITCGFTPEKIIGGEGTGLYMIIDTSYLEKSAKERDERIRGRSKGL